MGAQSTWRASAREQQPGRARVSFPEVRPRELFEHVLGLGQAAKGAGFDLVTVMEHFSQIRSVGPDTEPMLEAYTTLAACTSRVRLGTLVTGVTYRNPALLAKMVTTLDVISGGRALLGIGAATTRCSRGRAPRRR